MPSLVRDQESKTVYANGIGFALGDNDCRLAFGLVDVQDQDNLIEQVAVYMTHRTLKVLAYATKDLIDHHERVTGQVVPMDESRMEAIRAMLSAAEGTADTATPSANASQRLSEQSPPDAQGSSSPPAPSRRASRARRRQKK